MGRFKENSLFTVTSRAAAAAREAAQILRMVRFLKNRFRLAICYRSFTRLDVCFPAGFFPARFLPALEGETALVRGAVSLFARR